MDSSQEAAVCPYCKTLFITEKAINNYNTTNITNIDTLNAEVVNVESSDSATNLARTAEAFVSFGEWDKAREMYIKITQMYAFDWRGWYGLLQTNTHNFQLYFERYEDYEALVGIYEKLIAVADNSLPIISSVKEYLDIIHEKVKTALSDKCKLHEQFYETKIAQENLQFKNDVPTEIRDVKSFGMKATKAIWLCWAVIAFLVSLVKGIGTMLSGDYLDIEFGFVRFANMDSFWDVILFTSVFMLMLQVGVSFLLSLIGVFDLLVQKHSKQKRLTAFKFVTKNSIIAVSSHLIFWLITIFIVDLKDPGYFISYSGTYRYVETVLFHSTATETGACWIALLLIIIYSVLNYVLIAAPLFAMERSGDKKRNSIMLNIQHQQEVTRLIEQKTILIKHYDRELLKLEKLKSKYINK